jgi:SAM-dependent methyltransferase
MNDERCTYFENTFHLLGYHTAFFSAAQQHIDFRGKKVLEIGGSNMPRELVFDELGASKWVCVDTPWVDHLKAWPDHYATTPQLKFDQTSPERYIIYNGFAENIPVNFEQFDVCVSNCSFEHINNLWPVLGNIYRVLKPGGLFYTRFGPIWSCSQGSHFWRDEAFCFNHPEPIPSYAHLLLSYTEIVQILLDAKFPALDAEKWAYAIKNGSGVNRFFYEDYEGLMKRSSFIKYTIVPYATKMVDAEVQKNLIVKCAPYTRFEVWGIEIVASK